MLGCFGAPSTKEDVVAPLKRPLSRAETLREKKQQKQKQRVQRQTTSNGVQGLGFSFSGAGFLFPYFAGVAESLVHLQLITPSTHLAGASAGSLIAANVTSGLSPKDGLAKCLQFADDCRKNGCKGRLKHALRQHLLATLPRDAHLLVRGRTHVAVTQAVPLKRRMVSDWSSLEDLVECLVASCHLPRYSDDNLTSLFRGKAHMDGGVLNFIPLIPVAGVMTVGVCCFPSKYVTKMPVAASIKRMAICPDMFEPDQFKYTLKELMANAFEPGTDTFLKALYDRGRRDGNFWARSVGLARDTPYADARLQPSPGIVPSPPLHPALPPSHLGSDSSFEPASSLASLVSSDARTASEPSLSLSTSSSSMQTASQPSLAMSVSTSAQTTSQPSSVAASFSSMQVSSQSSSSSSSSSSAVAAPSSVPTHTATATLLSAASSPGPAAEFPSINSDSTTASVSMTWQPAHGAQLSRAAGEAPGSQHVQSPATDNDRAKGTDSASSTSSTSSSSMYSDALSADSDADSRLRPIEEVPGEALGIGGNPYSDAQALVSSLSSCSSCELGEAGGAGQAGSCSLLNQVIIEEQDAARSG